jgi:phospholipase C
MNSRRDFLKKSILLSGAGLTAGMFPPAIERAFAIHPEKGTTYLDAEHVVILMQENRSFDHCYGTLRGVRGFNDPRAIDLPNGNKVWLQTNESGETYAPFRLNIKDTKATWMGSLPHSWTDQVDAGNKGKHDQWLTAKKSGHPDFQKMPLTLGYYNREDLPFYYSLADAFTICDQNFCSSLTGTTPNRLYLWTGTIRDEQHGNSYARVRNSELDYDVPASWTTFPERLEENNIPWKIYQNELSVGVGFEGEEDAWLANFTDNPIEWFSQYHVQFLPAYIAFLPRKIQLLRERITSTENKLTSLPDGEASKAKRELEYLRRVLQTSIEEQKKYTLANYQKLTAREQKLHERAFTTNVNDPDYHRLTTIWYKEGNEEREIQVPKGDVLHQFRTDVNEGKLPMVSWLVAPENFSDHPGAPWYGAWYVAEVMDILTKKPEVWKKTIFILCYDENDGYFDHLPPFAPPSPYQPNSGATSKGIDTRVEHVTKKQDMTRNDEAHSRESAIGLGYRVPLVIASPWSRGGAVNSQVFDHTSILQFLEKFLSHKTGKKVEETNISTWRRTVCGDLTSVFQPYNGETTELPEAVDKTDFIESIHQAKFKKDPLGYKALTADEIRSANRSPLSSPVLPRQEKGNRLSHSLPYELYADGAWNSDTKMFSVTMGAGKKIHGDRSAGAPFQIYTHDQNAPRQYTVSAGDQLMDSWEIKDHFHFSLYGPNGFFREWKGGIKGAVLEVQCQYEQVKKEWTGNIELRITNKSSQAYDVEITDNAYTNSVQKKSVKAGSSTTVIIDLKKSFQWYDFTVQVAGQSGFFHRYAGRVENGKNGWSDPIIGQTV